MRKYKWGVLGAGRIAARQAMAIHQSQSGELYAVGSRSLSKSKAFAKEHGAELAFSSYEELCACEEIDIIYVATPHSFHCEHSLLAMNNAKHVLCEKPFAMDAGEARRMIDCAKENQVFLMEAMWSRLLPGMKKVKELLAGNAIGRIKSFSANFCFKSTPAENPRLFEPSLGGGALLDVGIYPLTLACSFFGFPESFEAKADLTEKGVDTTSYYKLNFANGIKAELMSSVVEEREGEAIITGEQGQIILHASAWKLKSITLKSGCERYYDASYDGSEYVFQIDEVHDCLDRGVLMSGINNFEWTLKLMQLMDSLRQDMGVSYKI